MNQQVEKMDLGTFLIWASVFLGGGALASSLLYHFTGKRYYRYYAIFGTVGCVGTITATYVLLTYYFFTSNFDIHYVWDHSGENFAWYLKMAGVWAGQEGSILMWVWLILLSLGIQELVQYRKRRKEAGNSGEYGGEDGGAPYDGSGTTYDWTRTLAMGVVIVFLILLVMKSPFVPTHAYEATTSAGDTFTIDPEDFPGGHGMNPMLRNLWMVAHPPLLFIGYAFITIPFAASLSYSITGDKKWAEISLQWSRLAWLFLTLGICVGAAWAYVALGWGGYWAWDPVEVASLIPWVTLSAFLHTQLMNKRKGRFVIVTPVLGVFTFLLVIFATFITRSGLWASVHAWSETTVGNILMATMATTVILSAVIVIRRFLLRRKENGSVGSSGSSRTDWSDLLMKATVITLGIFALIMFIGLLMTMGEPNPRFYETRLAPFVVVLLAALSACLCRRYLKTENLLYFFYWTLLTAVACAILLPRYVFPGDPEPFYFDTITNHHVVGFLVPFVVLTVIASIYKLAKLIRWRSLKDPRRLKNTLGVISPHIVHLGVALLFLGYGVSQTMTVETKETVSVGETMEVGGYVIELKEIEIEEDTGNKRSNEYWDTWYATVEIYEDGELIDKGKMDAVYYYYFERETGKRSYSMHMKSDVYVKPMLKEDLYVSFMAFNREKVKVHAKTIPMMSTLWAGMILFVLGIVVRTAVDYIPRKRGGSSVRARGARGDRPRVVEHGKGKKRRRPGKGRREGSVRGRPGRKRKGKTVRRYPEGERRAARRPGRSRKGKTTSRHTVREKVEASDEHYYKLLEHELEELRK